MFEPGLIKLLITIFAVYMIAAIPFGYYLGLAFGVDLTKLGSGGTGATNVLRNLGKWQAIVVLILDVAKGFIPIYYVRYHTDYFSSDANIFIALIILFLPILAHSKSVYICFKGGKSSATGLGIFLAINWLAALSIFVIWGLTVFISGISSLGSIVTGPMVPLLLWFLKEDLLYIIFAAIAFVYVVLIKHRSNIARLIKGEEYNFKKK